LTPAAAPATPELPTSYRISLQWQNRVLQFLSPQPLPAGKTVQLQINARGEVLLLAPAALAKTATAATTVTINNQPTNTQPTNNQPTNNTSAANSLLAASRTQLAPDIAQTPLLAPVAVKATPLQTLQQSLRETLPRQESLQTLVPLLQKLLSPEVKTQLPPLIAKMLDQILQSLPKPAQLQTADGVKHALQNSGSFLEARLAKSNAPASAPGEVREPVTKVLETDLKAQLTALLNIVRR
jgi:hypothetical protein